MNDFLNLPRKSRFYSRLFISTAILLLVGCGSEQRTIPKDKMAKIVGEMYLADAVTESNMRMYVPNDSMRIYSPILAQYGYDLKDFNHTIMKYADDPNQLQDLYKRVEEQLKARQEEYKPQARIEQLSANFWLRGDSLQINVNRMFDKKKFDVELKETGVYNISAEVKFAHNDSTKNPRIIAWFTDKNDSIIGLQEASLAKDTVYGRYNIRMIFDNKSFNKLKGCWMDYDTVLVKKIPKKKRKEKKDSIEGRQHVYFRNMSIKYDFAASDSLEQTEGMKQTDSVKAKKSVGL